MSDKFKIIPVLLTLAIVGFGITWLLYTAKVRPVWTKHSLIAHAAGGIDGKDYTNSEEAFLENYANGFRLFELDVTLSSEGTAVVRHDWDEDYGQKLTIANGTPATHTQFMSQKYYGKYTPMDIRSVISLMREFNDVFIIIDARVKTIGDADDIYKAIADNLKGIEEELTSRFIAQVFYESDLNVVHSHGFKEVLYVAGREGRDVHRYIDFMKTNNLNAISLYHERTTPEDLHALRNAGIKPYLHTLNDTAQMRNFQNAGAYGFFTDFIKPDDLKK